ncbi:MAG: GAF domain-containing protein, partial [Anaerolineae bacterium]
MENPGEPSLYQRLARLGIALLIAGTIVIYLALPIISWRWTQLPFPDLLFEHTLVVGGLRSQDREVELSGDPLLHLFAVGDQPVGDGADLRRILQNRSPGDSLALHFERRGGDRVYTRDVTLIEFPLSEWATLFWLPYAVGLIYLIMAVWVFYHRGKQGAGQSFALCCLAIALSTSLVFDLNTTHIFVWLWTAALPLAGAALVHLGFLFPEPLPLVRRRRLLRYLPYGLAAILILVAELNLYRAGRPWAYIAPWRWCYIAMGLALITFLGLMLYARARTVSEIVRKQVRLILVGSTLAFGPLILFMIVAGLFEEGTPFLPTLYLPPLVLFPLFIAYAILRYKLLGIDLVLSRGLAYTILTASVAAAYFLALTVLGEMLGFGVASHPVVAALLVIILIFVLEPLREGSEQLADRLLDRSRMNYRQSLQKFSRELASTPLGLPALLDRLESHIEPVAHSAPILIFLHDPMMGRYALRRASRFVAPDEGEVTFAQDGPLVRHLARHDGPLYLLDQGAQLPAGQRQQDEQQILDALGMVLFLPLRGKGEERLGGWVALGPRLSGEPYSPDDLNFLAALVDQATIAIENARLLDSLEQQLVRLDVLRQISEAVDLRQDLEDLLDLIYRQTCRVVEVDNFYVALYDASRQEFQMAFYVEEGRRREPEAQSWPLGTGLTSQIVRNGRPLVTDDYLAEVQRRGVSAGGRPARAWLGVPLKAGVGGTVLGVLNVSSFRPGYRYTEEQTQLMQAIGDQAAMAIDRMHLYREMEVRAAELATLNEINRTINSTLDLPSVLDLIMTKVVELLDVEAGSLLLVDDESDDLVFQVALGGAGSQDLIGRRHPAGKGIIGQVAE